MLHRARIAILLGATALTVASVALVYAQVRPSGEQRRRRFMPPFAMGKVQSVSGNKVVLQTQRGTRTVTLSKSVKVQWVAVGKPSDISKGQTTLVQGILDKDGYLNATSVVILPTAEMPIQAIGQVYDVRNGGARFGIMLPIRTTSQTRIVKLSATSTKAIKPGVTIVALGRPSGEALEANNVVVGTEQILRSLIPIIMQTLRPRMAPRMRPPQRTTLPR